MLFQDSPKMKVALQIMVLGCGIGLIWILFAIGRRILGVGG